MGGGAVSGSVEHLVPLALADGIVVQYRKAIQSQQCTGFLVKVRSLASRRVSTGHDDAWKRSRSRSGNVQRRRDVVIRSTLKDNLLDPVAHEVDETGDLCI